MNREDIIRMAREAGWASYDSLDERLERFFQLATEWERKRTRNAMKCAFARLIGFVRADEREQCAKVCMDVSSDITRFGTAAECVNAILARGQK